MHKNKKQNVVFVLFLVNSSDGNVVDSNQDNIQNAALLENAQLPITADKECNLTLVLNQLHE